MHSNSHKTVARQIAEEISASAAAPLRDRVLRIRKALLTTYTEREDAIECILLGAIAQQHVLFLGPPGTGKSHLVTSLTRCIVGCDAFVTLLTKYTTEDELCGPAKLSALKQDRFERATAGHLPTVHVAFLDEVYKANSACLNAILSIANERTYKGTPCPLRFLVGASNELPEDESLAAMHDRFLLRHVVGYVESTAKWTDMLESAPAFQVPATLTLADWDAIAGEARVVLVPRVILDELGRLRDTLKAQGIVASDRRWLQLLGVLRAAAWLDGLAEVEVDHLQALRFGLWFETAQIQTVQTVLNALPQGPVRQALLIVDEALEAVAKRPTDPTAYFQAIPALCDVCKKAAARLRQFEGKLSKRGTERVNEATGELRAAYDKLQKDLESRIRDRGAL